MIATSALVRFLGALPHRTITYYPDEYIYPTLARSFVTTGRFAIRGSEAQFPALLESIVTAPLWLGSDIELSMRLTQAMHAVVMSLAAVPVFLLSRRLGLGRWQSLAVAAFTLALPDLFFVGYLTADALAFTLALSAVYIAIVVLESPTRLGQAGFLALAGLATLARLQYVVLLGAFVGAALVVSGRHAPRRYSVVTGAIASCLLALPLVGVHRLLGYYSGITSLHIHPVQIVTWIGRDCGLLAFIAAGAVVPGAIVALGFMLVRPRLARERAFAAFVLLFALGLLLEAGVYASNGSDRFQERYLFVLLPLLPIAFFRATGIGKSKRVVVPLVAVAALITLQAARDPISNYSFGTSSQDSPFLTGYGEIERALGVSDAALLFALTVSALTLLGAIAVVRQRLVAPLVVVSILFGGGFSALAVVSHAHTVEKVERTYLPSDYRWIDHAGFENVSLIALKHSPRMQALELLFWNRSLKAVYLRPNSSDIDAFARRTLRIGPSGELLGSRGSLRTPFVVEEYADRARVSGATLVQRSLTSSLWAPTGIARFTILTEGLWFDGWLGAECSTTAWPLEGRRNRGTFVLKLGLPASTTRSLRVAFSAPRFRRTVTLQPGAIVTVRIPFDTIGAWQVSFAAIQPASLAGARLVSGFALHPPRIIRSRSAETGAASK
jgi:hypothetical protein